VTPDQKLAGIFHSLKAAGIDVLVMGGHAVRYYGIDRNTIDFDMVTSLSTPEELCRRLPAIAWLAAAREAPVWRSRDFARFEIGRLPDGREELLEFWLHNHLLPDFETLKSRSEVGAYGGGEVAFLSLADLIKSKETERESDWQDIALLEEVQDARLLAAPSAPGGVRRALANLRSRRGFEGALGMRWFDDANTVEGAIVACTHPVTYAFLAPLAPAIQPGGLSAPLDPAAATALQTAAFNSAKHLALVEIVRRGYKRRAMDLDRAGRGTLARMSFPVPGARHIGGELQGEVRQGAEQSGRRPRSPQLPGWAGVPAIRRTFACPRRTNRQS
jgi:hypothetical protein